MSHFVAYILQFQEIIVYKIPPGGGSGVYSQPKVYKKWQKDLPVPPTVSEPCVVFTFHFWDLAIELKMDGQRALKLDGSCRASQCSGPYLPDGLLRYNPRGYANWGTF